jgi:iron complex outermembrane recepter protein
VKTFRDAGPARRIAVADAWRRLTPVAALPAVLATGVCIPVHAQQADPPTASEQVVITGTRAHDRTELNSAVPIDVLTTEDLKAAAGPEANLGQALQSLLPSFNYLDQSNSGSADHVRAAQLRGLNPDQVLVLINGKRVHPTSIVNVESAIGVGSVAVDFASIPVNAVKRIEVLRDGAGAQYGSDAVAGVVNVILDDARSRGALELNAGEFNTRFKPTGRTINDGRTIDLQGKYGFALGDTGYADVGAEYSHHNPTNRAGFDQLYPNGDFNNPDPNSITQTFHVGDAKIENYNLWVNGGLGLSGGATLYAVALANHRVSVGDAYFREPNDTYDNGVYPNGFLPVSTGSNDDLHLSGGLKGRLAGPWDYDASLTHGQNDFRYGLSNSLNASYGTASPTEFNLGSFHFAQDTLNADLSGDVNWLGLARPQTAAFGAELRRETYKTEPGDPLSLVTAQGPLPAAPGAQGDYGLAPSHTSNSSRTVAGIYADLSGSVTQDVFADASARYDHYNDAGSAATGKLSARWEFVPRYALRGAVSNNFRAPALAQIWSAYTPSNYVQGQGLGPVQIVPVSDPNAIALGAKALKPERSNNYSVGLTAQPVAPLRLSLDFFQIDIRDRIALSGQIPDAFGNFFQFFTNAVDTRTRGAELVASWTTKLAGGDLRLSDASMRAYNSIRNIHPGAADPTGQLLFGLQAQNAITTAVPNQRDVVTASWAGGDWNLLLRTTRSGRVTRVFDFGGGFTPTQTYGSTLQFDLEAEVHITKDLALALGSQNIADRYPTLSSPDIGYFGNLPYDYLSPIGFNGRYVYARLHYDIR